MACLHSATGGGCPVGKQGNAGRGIRTSPSRASAGLATTGLGGGQDRLDTALEAEPCAVQTQVIRARITSAIAPYIRKGSE